MNSRAYTLRPDWTCRCDLQTDNHKETRACVEYKAFAYAAAMNGRVVRIDDDIIHVYWED